MKRHKVVYIEGRGAEPPSPADVEEAINKMATEGWSFLQLSTGGGGESDYVNSWVYLVFER